MHSHKDFAEGPHSTSTTWAARAWDAEEKAQAQAAQTLYLGVKRYP
jgi:hypothetical protein